MLKAKYLFPNFDSEILCNFLVVHVIHLRLKLYVVQASIPIGNPPDMHSDTFSPISEIT